VVGVTHAPPPLAFVRYINAVPDTFNMDFRAVDQVTYSQPFLNTAFRGLGVGNYQGYQAGSRHVRIFLDPNPSGPTVPVDPAVVSTVMVDTTFTFTAGTYYTLVHVGHARAPSTDKLLIITDALPAQSTTNVGYRVINAASVQGAVDVFVVADSTTALSGAPTLAAVAPLVPSAYQSRATGAFYIRLTQPGTFTSVGKANGYILGAGTAGTTLADPLFGSGIAGSVFTAFIFDASSAGTVGAVSATTSVVYFPDLQPPRTTTP
jgi:hypothetical protein